MEQAEDLGQFVGVTPPDEGVPWTLADIGRAIGLLILGIIVISAFAAGAGALLASGTDIEKDPTALTVVLILSLPLELAFVAVAFAFSVRKYGVPWAKLGLRPPDRGGILLAIGMFLGSLAIIAVYFGLLDLAGVSPEADLPDEVFDNVGPVVAVAVLSLLFAPVMEELFFRGFIFSGLRRRWGLIGGALGSGLLFGIAHLGNPGTFYVVPPIGLVGAFFAWGYSYSGSLYPSMGAHFLFNALSLGIGLAAS